MQTSLDHLAESTHAPLAQEAATIRENTDAASMIVVFGSYARGEQVSDPEGGYFSDLDLMVLVDVPQVAADNALWTRVSAAVRRHTGSAPVDIIVHDFREVTRELRRAQFFFVDIWQHAFCVLEIRREPHDRGTCGVIEGASTTPIQPPQLQHHFNKGATLRRRPRASKKDATRWLRAIVPPRCVA